MLRIYVVDLRGPTAEDRKSMNHDADELTTLLDTLESPYRIDDDRHAWAGQYDYRIEIDGGGAWVRNQRGFPPLECEGMECTC